MTKISIAKPSNMRSLFASGFYSFALRSVIAFLVFIPARAQGTKLEGGVDSLAPSTTLTIKQLERPSQLQLYSSIRLKRLIPGEDLLPQQGSSSLHTGINQDTLRGLPIAPLGLIPSLDVVSSKRVIPLNADIEVQSTKLPSLSIPIVPLPRKGSLDLAPKNTSNLQLFRRQGDLDLPTPHRSEKNPRSGDVSVEQNFAEVLPNHVGRRPDFSIEKMTPKSPIRIEKVGGLPININSLRSAAGLSLSPVRSDFIEINRIKPSHLSDMLITSARVRSKSGDISLNSLSVDIKLSKAPDSECSVSWDYWYEVFNRELAVAILEFANQVGNPSGRNKVMVSVSADGQVNCRILAGSEAAFDALILAAYNRISHSPFLRFPSGSVRKFVEFSVEHTHEEQGPVDEVRSSSIKGDSEKKNYPCKFNQ